MRCFVTNYGSVVRIVLQTLGCCYHWRKLQQFALFAVSLAVCQYATADKLYAIGDSITQGAVYDFDGPDYPLSAYRLESGGEPNDIRSYREHLHDRLTDNNSCDASVEWVGSRSLENRTPNFHEGRSGWRVDEFLNREWSSDTGGNASFSIDGWLSVFDPDHILIHLGTNDMLEGKTAEVARDDLQTLLNTIEQETPNASVFLANVIPIFGWWADHLNAGAFGPNNSADEAVRLRGFIEALVAERQAVGYDIHLVDVNRDFFVDTSNVTNCETGELGNPLNMSTSICKALPDGSGVEPDGVHPNVLGDKFIADKFFEALNTHTSLCAGDGFDNQAPVVEITSPSFDGETLPSVATLAGVTADSGGAGVDKVEVAVRNPSGDYLRFATGVFSNIEPSSNAILTSADSNSTEWSITTPGLAAGNYVVEVSATDYNGNTSSTISRAFAVRESNASEQPSVDQNLFFEAENGVLSGGMAVFADADASNGSYVSVVEGSQSTSTENDFVEFPVLIETAGDYQVSARVRGPDGSSHSFFAQIDLGEQFFWVTPSDNAWTTEYISDREVGDIRATLDAGIHTLRVSLRETGTQLDYIHFFLLDANGVPIEQPAVVAPVNSNPEDQQNDDTPQPPFEETVVPDGDQDQDDELLESVSSASGSSSGGGGSGFLLIGLLLLLRSTGCYGWNFPTTGFGKIRLYLARVRFTDR